MPEIECAPRGVKGRASSLAAVLGRVAKVDPHSSPNHH